MQMSNNPSRSIAIIGIHLNVPGAKTIEEFWHNLITQKESITFFDKEELKLDGIEEKLLNNPNYIPAKGYISDIDLFDAEFFRFTPRETSLLDPQQRLFLKGSWQALENARCNLNTYKGRVGVYASSSINSYLLYNLRLNPEMIYDYTGHINHQILLTSRDFLATRVAYKLNLKGPAQTIQTACSSSLVAVHHACHALLSNQCDLALAGGVSITIPNKQGYIYTKDSILSSDGHCRPFDKDATGTVPSNGIGIIVLKRLEEALSDKDLVYAVIKGSAINNDGNDKLGFMAPSINGQAEVISMAKKVADINLRSLGYIETHGTATKLGDVIEIKALTNAFAIDTQDKQFCAIGSVKGNIGHLDAAARIVGIIKASLILYNKKIPPNINYTEPNPAIDFHNTPFHVNTETKSWTNENPYPRRTAVSSFGIGGTNAHVILEEASPLKNPVKYISCYQFNESRYWMQQNAPHKEDDISNSIMVYWKQYLGINNVTWEDNFFNQGGDSFTAIEFVSALNHKLNLNLSFNDLVSNPILIEFIKFITNILNAKKDLPNTKSPILVRLRSNENNITYPLFFIHPAGGSVLFYKDLANSLNHREIYAIQDKGYVADPIRSIVKMAEYYIKEIKTVQPNGPYYLSGASFGGIVAYEMAQQLADKDEEVPLITMFDTPFPGYKLQFLNTNAEITKFSLSQLIGDHKDIGKKYLSKKQAFRLFTSLKNNKSFKNNYDTESKQIQFFNTYLKLFKLHSKMLQQYKIAPYKQKKNILYFEAQDNVIGFLENERPASTWQIFMKQKLKIYRVPGNHLSLIMSPNVETKIRTIIEYYLLTSNDS